MNIKEKEPITHTEAPQARLFAQHPSSGFGKLSVMALLGAAGTSGLLAIIIGFPADSALLIVTASLLGGAALATIRFRWMPLLLTLVSGLFLYQLLRAPFVLYHLTNPKANGSWQHGTAAPAHEPGAPTVNNVQVNGTSIQIGPFPTAGTYHLYCLVHQGMNLTIIVQ